MKKKIHPKWYPQAKVKCACGQTFTVGSTIPEIEVEICSQCHPFYTGQMKYVDTAGRVERFQKKQKAAEMVKTKKKKRADEKKKKKQPRTLREMLKKPA